MKPLIAADVLSLDDYLAVREDHRRSVRAARRLRRVSLGDRLSLSFENRETVLFQIHEMVRVEQIRDPDKLAEEVRVYNELLAGDHELSATFFVEITDRSRIRDDLDSLVGLERDGLSLEVDGERVPAQFEPGHARVDRISAVHYVRFGLPPHHESAIASGRARLRLLVEHPAYRAEAELSAEATAALAADLGVAASTVG